MANWNVAECANMHVGFCFSKWIDYICKYHFLDYRWELSASHGRISLPGPWDSFLLHRDLMRGQVKRILVHRLTRSVKLRCGNVAAWIWHFVCSYKIIMCTIPPASMSILNNFWIISATFFFSYALKYNFLHRWSMTVLSYMYKLSLTPTPNPLNPLSSWIHTCFPVPFYRH
jgi:hypothetical protein